MGVSRPDLVRAVDAGWVNHLARGVYALPDVQEQYVTAVVSTSFLTCTSAAVHYGLWLRRRPVDVHLASTQLRQVSGATMHRVKALAVGGPAPVVSVGDCVRHAAQCLPELDALLIAESAVVKGLVRLPHLYRITRGPGSRRLRRVLDKVDPAAQSLLETISRRVFLDAGLQVVSQHAIDGVGYVDLLVEGRLVVELDGAAFHSNREHYRQDRKRWNSLTVQGLPVLRFTYEDVLFRPSWMLRQVQEALEVRRG